jgi:alkylation response protein AidB-like acyl-CoA dehydrogenase
MLKNKNVLAQYVNTAKDNSMSDYRAPLTHMQFVLFDVLGSGQLADSDLFKEATQDTFMFIIEEAAKLAEQVLLPTNQAGDREGVKYDTDTQAVTTPTGFKEAYQIYQQGGWSGLSADPRFGGQGLPHLLKMVVDEMVCSTNLSFGMYPGLSHGAIDALTEHGSAELQEKYLHQLIGGSVTGTMCLTEPQCGTDLALIRTKAIPNEDNSYNITGTKIWITGGDHDLSDNILHLVLAKLPDAPQSSKGISLFLVPKFLDDNTQNNVHCGGLEHKMGINGSATCVMNFEDAKAWLIGTENEGLKCMFTMMNAARLMVGTQGLGLAETAYQVSLEFAKERLQSRSISGPAYPDKAADPIIVHADVRRMLLRQKLFLEGSRAMAYWTAMHLDLSHAADTTEAREYSDDILQLMTPVVKAHLTDEGFFSIDQALQSMGGSGYTKDWPIEQLMRDARIARIYEGTNGIQALDLVGRKLLIKDGRLSQTYFNALENMLTDASAEHQSQCKIFIDTLQMTLNWLMGAAMKDPEEIGAAATPLLRMFALTTQAVLWAKMSSSAAKSEVAEKYSSDFIASQSKCAEHFFRLYRGEIKALYEEIKAGKKQYHGLY